MSNYLVRPPMSETTDTKALPVTLGVSLHAPTQAPPILDSPDFTFKILEDPVTRAILKPPERRMTSPVMIAKQLSAKICSKTLLSKQIRAILNASWCDSRPREASYWRSLVPYSTVVLPDSPLLYMYDVLTAARAVHTITLLLTG